MGTMPNVQMMACAANDQVNPEAVTQVLINQGSMKADILKEVSGVGPRGGSGEGTYVEDYRVESDDFHGMFVVAVYDIGGKSCVADLKTSTNCNFH